MSISLCFWILALLALVFGLAPMVRPNTPSWWGGGTNLILWLLILLLGWHVFGPAIHG